MKAYKGGLQYDFDNNILLNWYPPRVIELAQSTNSILELGIGHGYATSIFANHFETHTVLDGAPAIIDNFKHKYPNCKANITETRFEQFTSNEKFDVIVMGFVLEHVEDPVKILSHYKTFLSATGQMFAAVPNAESLNRRIGQLAGLLDDVQLLSENDLMLGHKRFYTVNTLKEDITKAGYNVKCMEGIYLKPLTTPQMLSLDLDESIIDALCKIGVSYPELSCGILCEISPIQ
jgi:trans-aconitate methyltransferase